jgi:hypothetical protein
MKRIFVLCGHTGPMAWEFTVLHILEYQVDLGLSKKLCYQNSRYLSCMASKENIQAAGETPALQYVKPLGVLISAFVCR